MVMGPNESSWVGQRAQEMINILETEYMRPSVVFKAKLTKHFDKWCAYIGNGPLGPVGAGNIKTEFFALGDSPDEAMCNFDKAWREKLTG